MRNIQPITKEEWLAWKANKVTYEFVCRLYDQREEYKEALAEGQGETRQQQDTIIGRCQGLKDAIDYASLHFEVLENPQEDKTNA